MNINEQQDQFDRELFSQNTSSPQKMQQQASRPSRTKQWIITIVLITIGALAVAGAVPFFFPSAMALFGSDIPPIDDSDLALRTITVPNEENAYFDLIKLENVVDEPDDFLIFEHIEGEVWDAAAVEDLLTRNEQAFIYLHDASKKPKYQFPLLSAPISNPKVYYKTVLPSMNPWRALARVNAVRALHLMRGGNGEAALEKAMETLVVGHKIEESQNGLIGYLVALAMKGVSLEVMHDVVQLADVPSDALVRYAEMLKEFKADEESLKSVWKIEQYWSMSFGIDLLTAKDPDFLAEGPFVVKTVQLLDNDFYWQPNKAKMLHAEHTRKLIAQAEQPCWRIEPVEVERFYPYSVFTENAVAKIMFDVTAASLPTSVIERKCDEDMLVSAARLLFALKAFQMENEAYPSSLSDLIPRYISDIPVDPYSGGSFKYDPSQLILYSVGEDGIDSGGSEGDDWREMPDPTFQIEK